MPRAQTVRPAQLHSLTFRYGKIPKSLLAQVRCLDLGSADEDDTLTAARSLYLFENIHELVLSRDASQVLVPGGYYRPEKEAFVRREEHPFAREAFQAQAASITKVIQSESRDEYTSGARAVLEAAAVPAAIKVLHLRHPEGGTFFAPRSREMKKILTGCDALEELVIHENPVAQIAIPEPSRADWLGDMRLPALKTLDLPATDFAILDLLHAWLPNIATLAIRFKDGYGAMTGGLDDDRMFRFPNLRKLSLQGPPDILKIFKHLDIDCLEELKIEVEALSGFKWVDFDPFEALAEIDLPRGLRLNLYLPCQAHIDAEWGSFRDDCEERGVDFTLYTVDILAPFSGNFLADSGFATEVILRERYVAIARVLYSATERLNWLLKLGDAVGLKQMAEAMSEIALLELASRT